MLKCRLSTQQGRRRNSPVLILRTQAGGAQAKKATKGNSCPSKAPCDTWEQGTGTLKGGEPVKESDEHTSPFIEQGLRDNLIQYLLAMNVEKIIFLYIQKYRFGHRKQSVQVP